MQLFLIIVGAALILLAGVLTQNLLFARKRVLESLHREADIKNFLNIFSQNMKNVDNVERVMMLVARHVADLCDAQAVCVYKTDADGTLRVQGYCGAYPPMLTPFGTEEKHVRPKFVFEALRRERIAPGQGLIGHVAQLNDGLLLEDATHDARLTYAQRIVPIQTLMAIPLLNEGHVDGVICAINNRRNERAFSQEQFSRFKFISKQIIIALNIIAAYTSLAEQDRIAQELNFARSLQRSMLPSDFPTWDQFKIYQASRPAKEVSGDFYDFVPIDDHRMLAAVVDVCGKGIPACMVMSMTRTYMHSYARAFKSLHDFLFELNDCLYKDTERGMYATMACCLIDSRENTVEIARAGHTGILMHVRNHHRVIFPRGTGLGLIPSSLAEFDTLILRFTPGMSLLMYTDGFSEASNENGEEFGQQRIAEIFDEVCINRNLSSFGAHLTRVVDNFTGGETTRQEDDQTFVLINNPHIHASTPVDIVAAVGVHGA